MLRMSTVDPTEDPKGDWRRRPVFWLAVAVLTIMSLLPTERLPEFTASIWDKAQHAAGFSLLSVLGLWAYPGRGQRTALMLGGLVSLGAVIEVAQGASGWRHADLLDAVANAVGVAMGWALMHARRRWWAL
jgi:VanZ family protein